MAGGGRMDAPSAARLWVGKAIKEAEQEGWMAAVARMETAVLSGIDPLRMLSEMVEALPSGKSRLEAR